MGQSAITLNETMKNPQLYPCKYHLLVKPNLLPSEIKGLMIPKSAQERHQTTDGVILRLGQECPSELEVGQRVLFSRYVGIVVTVERENPDGKGSPIDEAYQLLHYEDIKCVIKDESISIA